MAEQFSWGRTFLPLAGRLGGDLRSPGIHRGGPGLTPYTKLDLANGRGRAAFPPPQRLSGQQVVLGRHQRSNFVKGSRSLLRQVLEVDAKVVETGWSNLNNRPAHPSAARRVSSTSETGRAQSMH